jgi:hypothetical protein
MTCCDARRLIEAYVDGELTGADRLTVSGHLAVCHACAEEEAALRDIGEMLRGAAALQPMPTDQLQGLAGGVVSRIGAEAQQSFTAKWSRVFEDWHWVAIGSGACSAAFVSAVLVFAALYSPTTQARQMNEKVGTLCLMAVPEDGAGAPVMLEYESELGTARPGRGDCSVPASFGWKAEQALIAALDTSLMRYGRLATFASLSAEEREEVENLLAEIGRMRNSVPSRRPSGLTRVSGMHLELREVVTASGL